MWFPLTPTICVPFLKTRGRPSSEERLSFCKYRTNHYFWMALILERNQQTGSMEINYWIRTGHAHPPQIFYFQFLSGQSVIINLFHPTSAEDRLVVVKRRICTRYLNYFNPFNSYSQLMRQLSFRDFGLFFFSPLGELLRIYCRHTFLRAGAWQNGRTLQICFHPFESDFQS